MCFYYFNLLFIFTFFSYYLLATPSQASHIPNPQVSCNPSLSRDLGLRTTALKVQCPPHSSDSQFFEYVMYFTGIEVPLTAEHCPPVLVGLCFFIQASPYTKYLPYSEDMCYWSFVTNWVSVNGFFFILYRIFTVVISHILRKEEN